MAQQLPSGGPSAQAAYNVEDLLRRFDQAWRSGPPPRIEDFLPPVSAVLSDLTRRELLEELIKIDLECRWRQATDAAGRPRLQDYAARFPELGLADCWSLALLGEEYRARQRWGDRPAHTEYLARFGQHGLPLREMLHQIDAELSAEFSSKARNEGIPAAPLPGDIRPAPSPIEQPDMSRDGDLATVAVAAVLDFLRRSSLLSPPQLNDLLQMHRAQPFPDARALGGELLRRDWLTAYQVNQLVRGRGAELVLGPYLLLERLGEGGSGQVFKARHQKMERVVALKLIRRELLTDPEVVGRFYREIQVVSQLDHPNVIHAFDAGPISSDHVLVMEYVEGTDLSRLVKKSGPLPAARACDYIRQAALGLQHAHERGLVHRDIKPSNLLLSLVPCPSSFAIHKGQMTNDQGPIVKILDLGLARLCRTTDGPDVPAANADMTVLTPKGAVVMMGTPDYLAPEQALNFHGADIRADIYSLGCTFYLLLTGQAPFAGGTVPEKLVRHQQVQPPPVEEKRRDLSPGVAGVLRKMMAKRPADRYQSPAEVAQALAQQLTEMRTRYGRLAHFLGLRRRRAANRWRRAVAGILLLAVLLVASFFLLRSGLRPDPAKTEEAAAPSALREIQRKLDRSQPNLDEVRQDILQVRTHYPGTPEAREAGLLLMRLPSPLDKLDANQVPPGERPANSPKELVAVWRHGPPHQGLRCVAIAPDGRTVASGDNRSLCLWETDSGKKRAEISPLPIVYAVAFAPDGKTLASANSSDRPMKLWDVASGKELAVLPQQGGSIEMLGFAPDGKVLLSVNDQKTTLKAWDMATRQERYSLSLDQTDRLHSFAFSPDSRTLVAATISGNLRFWEAATGKASAVFKTVSSHIVFAPDGQTLAIFVGGNSIRLWDVATKTPRKTVFRGLGGAPLAFTLDAKLVSVSSDGKAFLWDLDSGKILRERQFLPGVSWSLAPDGRHLASTNLDGTVHIYRLAPRE